MKRVATLFILFFVHFFLIFGQFCTSNYPKTTGELIIWRNFPFFRLQNRKFIGLAVIFTKIWQ
jgi:hypothetical protein